MSNDIIKAKKSKLFIILIGVVIGVAVTLAFLLLFAAMIYFLNLDRAYSTPLATLSIALGSFAAAYFVSKKAGQKGLITGILVGAISFALVTVLSLIITKNGITLNTLFHFVIILLASAIGGILGVNTGKNKKLI